MNFASFLLRFFAYAAVMAIVFEISQYFWTQNGLDSVDAVSGLHAILTGLVALAPIVLALVAIFARPLAFFGLCYLTGVLLTAPFALARLVS